MTHKAIHTGNPHIWLIWFSGTVQSMQNSANLLSVTRCNTSFGAQGFCSAAGIKVNHIFSVKLDIF